MRITGGNAAGVRIKTSKGDGMRPAMDSVREALFSSLGNLVINKSFVDLFAGSGAYGLEAWSRGATSGTFIEKDRKHIKTLQDNIAIVAKSANTSPNACQVLCRDALKFSGQADLVFLDPPYTLWDNHMHTLLELGQRCLSNNSARLIVECDQKITHPPALSPIKELCKGRITIFKNA